MTPTDGETDKRISTDGAGGEILALGTTPTDGETDKRMSTDGAGGEILALGMIRRIVEIHNTRRAPKSRFHGWKAGVAML
jgi:hypothetical protein